MPTLKPAALKPRHDGAGINNITGKLARRPVRHFLDRYLGLLREPHPEIAKGNNYIREIIRVKLLTPMTTARILQFVFPPKTSLLPSTRNFSLTMVSGRYIAISAVALHRLIRRNGGQVRHVPH